jgi:hypothetical protein
MQLALQSLQRQLHAPQMRTQNPQQLEPHRQCGRALRLT